MLARINWIRSRKIDPAHFAAQQYFTARFPHTVDKRRLL